MATYTNIKKAFFALSPKEQEAMFKEIYGFSKDMKSFLDISRSIIVLWNEYLVSTPKYNLGARKNHRNEINFIVYRCHFDLFFCLISSFFIYKKPLIFNKKSSII